MFNYRRFALNFDPGQTNCGRSIVEIDIDKDKRECEDENNYMVS